MRTTKYPEKGAFTGTGRGDKNIPVYQKSRGSDRCWWTWSYPFFTTLFGLICLLWYPSGIVCRSRAQMEIRRCYV